MIFIEKLIFKKDYEPFSKGEEIVFENLNLLVGDQGAGKSTLIHLLNQGKNKKLVSAKTEELMGSARFMQDKGVASINEKGITTDVDNGALFDEYDGVFDLEHAPEYNLNVRFLDTEAHNPRIKFAEYDSKRPLMQELSIICREIHKAVQNEKDKGYVREIFNEYYTKSHTQKNDIDGNIINSHKSHGETILPMLEELTSLENYVILLDEPETSLSIRSQHKIVDAIRKMLLNGNQVIIATHSSIIMEAFGKVLSLEHRRWMPSKVFLQTQQT